MTAYRAPTRVGDLVRSTFVKKQLQIVWTSAVALGIFITMAPALAQSQTPGTPNGAPPAATGVPLPAGFILGPEDVVNVVIWRNQEMSGDFIVRPDGLISMPLLNDVQAAGLTPDQLREQVTKAATKFLEEPSVTVVVKAINSRKVHITGMVQKPGAYPLISPTTVLQLISIAGGLHEFADAKKIMIVRQESGRQVSHKFNYKDVSQGKNLKQNIELKPGDTVIVP
jgi:polysaccharide export outer membrane protein